MATPGFDSKVVVYFRRILNSKYCLNLNADTFVINKHSKNIAVAMQVSNGNFITPPPKKNK